MVYWIGYILFRIFRFLFFPCRIIGRDHLPKEGGFIFASNHASNLDPFLLGIIPHRGIYFFAKKELFQNPIFGWLMRQWHAFPVDRSRADIGALKTSIRYLKNGSPLVFFPQGTRQARSAGRGRVFSGIGFLVSKTGVPVIPAYINGSDQCLPPGAKFPRRRRITITIGSPLVFRPDDAHDVITAQVMDAILALKDTDKT